jgi:hypothetical protein
MSALGSASRDMLARRANEVARLSSRPGAPLLTHESTGPEVVAWLRWNDPNGTHTWHSPLECELGERRCIYCSGDEPSYPADEDPWLALDSMIADV